MARIAPPMALWQRPRAPNQPPTCIHLSRDGLRQGETASNVFFNILVARLYIVFMKIIDNRGTLFTLADDVNFVGPPAVLAKIVAVLPALAMSEAGLTTQASKNIVYVQSSAREAWTSYFDDNPRITDMYILCIHDIPDGRNPPPEENENSF